MATLIKERHIVADSWRLLRRGPKGEMPEVPARGDVIIPLALGYEGELRAIGDVLHDHLFFMSQCGFDAFALREDQDAQEALSVFGTFSESYQTSVLRPVPLFRRRLAAGKS